MMDESSVQSRFFHQKPGMTAILEKGLLRFVIRMFSCCVIVSCIFTTVSGKVDGCLNENMQSLLVFKSGFHDPGGRLASWNVSISYCRWEGVSCDSLTGRVVVVDFHNCSLSGILRPAVLFNLTALEHLDVSFNNFSGLPIPTEMGLLKNLKYLNLLTAGFAGTIPWQLGNPSYLTGLNLSSPAFMLQIPDLSWLAHLTALTNLSLNGVNLSATSFSWGQSVSRLSQLINVTMSNCGLMGSIPPSLKKLRNLGTLHLDGNTFQFEFPPWLTNMTSLIDLQTSNANLSGPLPFERLSQMPRLGWISLGNNKLSANVSQIFQGQWKSLTFFQMPNNSLYGFIPSSIGNLSSLSLLQLRSNNLRGTIPESLGLLRSLTVLDLGYNKLTGPIPLSLGSLSKLTNISLTHNALAGAISEPHFRSLNNLKYLDLSSNKLAFKITSSWTPPLHLDLLILSHCQIKGAFPLFLKTQSYITTLDLSNNTLTGQIPSWLWNLPKLERLVLSHNQLQGPIPLQLYNSSSSLKEVELRDNQLHGNLSNPAGSSVAGFPWELDLSINKITGSVPQEITHININDLHFFAFPLFVDGIQCMKKISHKVGNVWHCEKCDGEFIECAYRYILKLDITDAIGQLYGIIAFDDAAQQLMGVSAKYFCLLSNDPTSLLEIVQHVCARQYLLTLSVKTETFNSNARLKVLLVMPEEVSLSLNPVNTLDESEHIVLNKCLIACKL